MCDTYLTPQQKAERAISRGDAALASPCYVCQKMLWLSFFFDAPKRDATADQKHPEELTNIGKLFAIHSETDRNRGVYRIYFSGLQRPLNTQDHAKKETRNEIAVKNMEDAVKDKIQGTLKDAAKSKKIDPKDLLKLLDPRNWKDALIKAATSIGAESTGIIRDNPIFSSFTGSGVDTRINNAIFEFKDAVASQTEKIKHIKIAIFGADMGGAIARAFANKLINTTLTIKDKKILYGAIEVEFIFMGLFDCVSSRSKNIINSIAMSKASLGFYSQGLDAPMGIREDFRAVYHAVAAHENRPYKRIDSVRKCKSPNVQEELFAGEQGDVVGGHPAGEQGRSNQFSRLPLMRMHSIAMAQAVPFKSLEDVARLDVDLANAFDITDKLIENGSPRSAVSRYLAVMRPAINASSLEEGLAAGAQQRLHWLAVAYADPVKRQKYFPIFDRLNKQIQGINNAFNDPIARQSLVPVEVTNASLRTLLASELKLLSFWERDYHFYNEPRGQRPNSDDLAISALFEQFIHDAIPEMVNDGIDQMESGLTTGSAYWGYLTPRSVDESEKFTSD